VRNWEWNCRRGLSNVEKVALYSLEKLESMVGSSVVSSEETMPELEDIYIERL
jgi:hypothetical protein